MIIGRIILASIGVVAVVGGAGIASHDGWLAFILGIALIMGGGGAFMMAVMSGPDTDDCGKEGCDCE